MGRALVFVLVVVTLSFALLGCATADGSSENAGRGMTSPGGSSRGYGGTAVGPAIAQAKLEPTSDISTGGTAVFKGVGSTDVQVQLDVSGLPEKSTDAGYYAQVHEGSCSQRRSKEDHEQHEHGAAVGPALALIGFDRLLADGPEATEASGLLAHGEEHGVPEEPPGSIEQAVSFGSSSEGTISVVALLEGVAPKRLTTGGPKYVHVHDVRHEGSPEELACGDLRPVKVSS